MSHVTLIYELHHKNESLMSRCSAAVWGCLRLSELVLVVVLRLPVVSECRG